MDLDKLEIWLDGTLLPAAGYLYNASNITKHGFNVSGSL